MISFACIFGKEITFDMKITKTTPSDAVIVELGQRLAKQRKRLGLNQDEVATLAGVGVATIRRIEDGRDAQLGSWIKILSALGEIGAIERLLPEELKSPMAEVNGSKKSKKSAKHTWGDEQ